MPADYKKPKSAAQVTAPQALYPFTTLWPQAAHDRGQSPFKRQAAGVRTAAAPGLFVEKLLHRRHRRQRRFLMGHMTQFREHH